MQEDELGVPLIRVVNATPPPHAGYQRPQSAMPHGRSQECSPAHPPAATGAAARRSVSELTANRTRQRARA